MAKNAAVYLRVPSETQKKFSQKNGCVRIIENGLTFIECNKCGFIGIENRISRSELKDTGSYPKPKCPVC